MRTDQECYAGGLTDERPMVPPLGVVETGVYGNGNFLSLVWWTIEKSTTWLDQSKYFNSSRMWCPWLYSESPIPAPWQVVWPCLCRVGTIISLAFLSIRMFRHFCSVCRETKLSNDSSRATGLFGELLLPRISYISLAELTSYHFFFCHDTRTVYQRRRFCPSTCICEIRRKFFQWWRISFER